MLRWHLQQGRSAADLARVDALDTGIRGGPEPDTIMLEAYGRAIPEA